MGRSREGQFRKAEGCREVSGRESVASRVQDGKMLHGGFRKGKGCLDQIFAIKDGSDIRDYRSILVNAWI